MGLLSNLTTGEIVEQLLHANDVTKIRNVVFMGMGEPLDNYTHVLSAIRAMTDTARFGLSPARITVSTVGVVPKLYALMKDAPDVSLALSLHAPNQELRTEIVPTGKAWHINKVLDAAFSFVAHQNQNVKTNTARRHILIEYVVISKVNDMPEIAHQLGALLEKQDALLNLIPYNPTDVGMDYKAPTAEDVKEFMRIVREVYGVHTLLRQELGQDIDSACGQLVIKDARKRKEGGGGCESGGKGDVKDLEDLVVKSNSGRTAVGAGGKGRSKRRATVDHEGEYTSVLGRIKDKVTEGATPQNIGLAMAVIVAVVAVRLWNKFK
jgi:sorting nexin-8